MARTRRELEEALDELLARPDEHEHLAGQIEAGFGLECAVLVVDMTGFSRETQLHGIVAYLALIRTMQRSATPSVESRDGRVVKAEADNLFCVFGRVEDAVDAAREIVAAHDTSVGIGFGQVLDVGDDLWGNEVNLASKLGEDIAVRGEILLTEGACAQLAHTCEQRLLTVAGLELVYYSL